MRNLPQTKLLPFLVITFLFSPYLLQANEEKKHSDHSSHAKDHKKEEAKHEDEHDEKHEEGHEHEEEEGASRFGPGKAIIAANKKQGIQLSPQALKTLALTYTPVSGTGLFKVPLKSVVFFQDEVGIYRMKDGWHKLIEVELVSKTQDEATLRTSELKPGDKIVKDGVALLRAAELEAWGGSGDGHGH